MYSATGNTFHCHDMYAHINTSARGERTQTNQKYTTNKQKKNVLRCYVLNITWNMNIVIVHGVIYGRGTMPNFHSCSFGKQTTEKKIPTNCMLRATTTATTTKKVKEEKTGKNTSNPIELMKLKVAINEPSKCKNLHCHGSSVALQKLSFFHSLTRSVVRSFDCLLAHVIIELRQPVKTFTTLHLPIVNKWGRERQRHKK